MKKPPECSELERNMLSDSSSQSTSQLSSGDNKRDRDTRWEDSAVTQAKRMGLVWGGSGKGRGQPGRAWRENDCRE